MAEQAQRSLELPEPVKEWLKEKASVRKDVLDIAMSMVFKAAEMADIYLNPTYILSHTIAARVIVKSQGAEAELVLDNGIVIKAFISRFEISIDVQHITKYEG